MPGRVHSASMLGNKGPAVEKRLAWIGQLCAEIDRRRLLDDYRTIPMKNYEIGMTQLYCDNVDDRAGIQKSKEAVRTVAFPKPLCLNVDAKASESYRSNTSSNNSRQHRYRPPVSQLLRADGAVSFTVEHGGVVVMWGPNTPWSARVPCASPPRTLEMQYLLFEGASQPLHSSSAHRSAGEQKAVRRCGLEEFLQYHNWSVLFVERISGSEEPTTASLEIRRGGRNRLWTSSAHWLWMASWSAWTLTSRSQFHYGCQCQQCWLRSPACSSETPDPGRWPLTSSAYLPSMIVPSTSTRDVLPFRPSRRARAWEAV